MSAPRDIHAAEQAMAAFTAYAAGFGKAYATMVAEGVPPDHAVQITVAMAAALCRRESP